MLTVAGFKTTEVAFQPVRRMWNQRIVEVAEHMRQGVQQKGSGSFDVGEDLSPARSCGDWLAEPFFPLLPSDDKTISIGHCGDVGHLFKESAQMFNGGGVRVAATPGQSLALDMDETALDNDGGPRGQQHRLDLLQSVYSHTDRLESSLGQMTTEGHHFDLSFLEAIAANHDGLMIGVSDTNNSGMTLFQICPVKEQVLGAAQINVQHRWTFKPVSNDASHCHLAPAALPNQLTYGIPFDDPSLEPDSLSIPPSRKTRLDKALSARRAVPTLLAMHATIPHRSIHTTLPTVSFLPITETPQLLPFQIPPVQANIRNLSTLFDHYAHCEEFATGERRGHLVGCAY